MGNAVFMCLWFLPMPFTTFMVMTGLWGHRHTLSSRVLLLCSLIALVIWIGVIAVLIAAVMGKHEVMRLPRPYHCPGRGAITRNLGKLTKDKDPELRAPGGNGEFAQERVLRHDGPITYLRARAKPPTSTPARTRC